jgi:triacylglycerol esterase/lipase EstA (alpha/beta hydrolase family)
MIARWQRINLFITASAVAAWLLWQWPLSPLRALLGALAPLGMYLAVTALEFACMHHANRRAGNVPSASAAQMLAAWWAEVRVALVVFCWRQPFRWHSQADWLPAQRTGRRGVVLLHGFMCNRGFWLPWMGPLRAQGHAFVALNLEPVLGSIDDYAAAIDDAVRQVTEATGLAPVLLCHSMGGLAARAWLRSAAEGGPQRVHRVLTLGSPHGGTWLARWGQSVNGRQMRLQSEWLGALHAAEPVERVHRMFTCWYSNCDHIVFPARTATLEGADNRLVTGLAHVQMAFDPGVERAVMAELAADATVP